MSKPYDRLFKSLAAGDPRGLLHLFGSLPLDAEAEVQAVEREQNLPTLAVDHVYRVRTPQREWLGLRPLEKVLVIAKFLPGCLATEPPVDLNTRAVHPAVPRPTFPAKSLEIRDSSLAQALPGE